MERALDIRTSRPVSAADADRSRRRDYICLLCLVAAHLRAGLERTYFAHDPNKGTVDCPEYHPGQGNYPRGARRYVNRFVRRGGPAGWSVYFLDKSGRSHAGIVVDGARPSRATWRAKARPDAPTLCFVLRSGRYRQILDNALFEDEDAIVLTKKSVQPPKDLAIADLGPFTIDGEAWRGWHIHAATSATNSRKSWLDKLGIVLIGLRAEFLLVTPPHGYADDGEAEFYRDHRALWRLPKGSTKVALDLPDKTFKFHRSRSHEQHFLSISMPVQGRVKARLPGLVDVIEPSFTDVPRGLPPAAGWSVRIDGKTVAPYNVWPVGIAPFRLEILTPAVDLLFDLHVTDAGSSRIVVAGASATEIQAAVTQATDWRSVRIDAGPPGWIELHRDQARHAEPSNTEPAYRDPGRDGLTRTVTEATSPRGTWFTTFELYGHSGNHWQLPGRNKQ